jgi:KDO2-lipid IV(A) lauroyltransferase
MNLQTFTNSSIALNLVISLGKLPPSVGYPIGRFLADRIAARKDSALVLNVRANQWIVNGCQLSSSELDKVVRGVFRHAARCYYDLYRNLRSPEALKRLSPTTDQVEALIQRSRSADQGVMVVGAHTSNFDLVMLATAHRGLQAQGISPKLPSSGYRSQNRIRSSTGLEITPASTKVMHQAIQRMRNGKVILTGADRPIEGDKHHPVFFGRPSNLPTGHVRMAMKAGVPVMVASGLMSSDGIYHFHLSEPIPMRQYDSRSNTIRKNTETLLEVIANTIRLAPDQWLMFHPVWPEALEEMP